MASVAEYKTMIDLFSSDVISGRSYTFSDEDYNINASGGSARQSMTSNEERKSSPGDQVVNSIEKRLELSNEL